ncbi:MAG: group 1 truncated hemoglobin [Chitinophagales bacterium]|nr:group 1 truncated hemoglobin [Bacteroidota bacterium]
MIKNKMYLVVLAMAATLFYTSCKEDETPDPTPVTPSLYTRVGGTTLVDDPAAPGTMIEAGRLTLRSVVDSSIFVIAADPEMAAFFPVLLGEVTGGDFSGFVALSDNFTDFLCSATGSTNPDYAYIGLSMTAAHDPGTNSRMGMAATDADFDAFIGDIAIGLSQNGVTDTELINDLVELLETTRADIVQM